MPAALFQAGQWRRQRQHIVQVYRPQVVNQYDRGYQAHHLLDHAENRDFFQAEARHQRQHIRQAIDRQRCMPFTSITNGAAEAVPEANSATAAKVVFSFTSQSSKDRQYDRRPPPPFRDATPITRQSAEPPNGALNPAATLLWQRSGPFYGPCETGVVSRRARVPPHGSWRAPWRGFPAIRTRDRSRRRCRHPLGCEPARP